MKSLAVVLIVIMAVASGVMEVKRRPEVYGPYIPDWADAR